jgi:hypothetical protein
MKHHGYVWAAVAVAPSRYYDDYDDNNGYGDDDD